jgi:two-component system chemotaxis response regulator CheB
VSAVAPSLAGRVDAIVVGASAGGVEALSALLPALPAGLAAPVFVVLHLPRERPSLLVEIFQPKCALPIHEAEDKEPVEAGTVYFAPPDYHLLVDDGPRIALSTDAAVHYSRPSIDVLFESAADRFGARLLAIVLTGANEDGAAGAAAVRRAGGITLVQQPDGAQSPLMPQAALRLADPTYVLALPAMAALLGTLAPAAAAMR